MATKEQERKWEDHRKRKHQIKFYLSDWELARAQGKARKLDGITVNQLAKAALLDQEVKVHQVEIKQLFSEEDRTALTRIGTLLNQIAHRLNSVDAASDSLLLDAKDALDQADWALKGLLAGFGAGKPLDVRMQLADAGEDEDLDKLVFDPAWQVRQAVAMQGRDRDLDILVSDPEPAVRREVVEQGRPEDLQLLVTDDDPQVRALVATSRYVTASQLELLARDDDWRVAQLAQDMLEGRED